LARIADINVRDAPLLCSGQRKRDYNTPGMSIAICPAIWIWVAASPVYAPPAGQFPDQEGFRRLSKRNQKKRLQLNIQEYSSHLDQSSTTRNVGSPPTPYLAS